EMLQLDQRRQRDTLAHKPLVARCIDHQEVILSENERTLWRLTPAKRQLDAPHLSPDRIGPRRNRHDQPDYTGRQVLKHQFRDGPRQVLNRLKLAGEAIAFLAHGPASFILCRTRGMRAAGRPWSGAHRLTG